MIKLDDIVNDMLLGTCWSNIKYDGSDQRVLLNPGDLQFHKGVSVRENDWREVGNTSAILALAGFSKQDISVEIQGQTVLVVIHNWNGQAKMVGHTYKLLLGDHVNLDTVTASMENGLLTINYPSKPEYQRTIEIK